MISKLIDWAVSTPMNRIQDRIFLCVGVFNGVMVGAGMIFGRSHLWGPFLVPLIGIVALTLTTYACSAIQRRADVRPSRAANDR